MPRQAPGLLVRFVIVVLALTLTPPLALFAKSWKDDLIAQITAVYVPTDRSFWDLENVKGGGTVLVLTQDGALASLSTDSRYWGSDVKDGKISIEGAPMGRNSRLFKRGERVFLMDVKIAEYQGSEIVRMFILTADATERVEKGGTATRRYKGVLDFYFPKGTLQTAEFAEVKKVLNTVLVAESEFQDQAPATVALGMTPQEVEAVLGKPSKVIDLGAKKMFVYSDIKVTFVDGKVSDVE